MTDSTSRTPRGRGEALAAYLKAVRDAGPAGINACDIAKANNITRTQTVTTALLPLIRNGTIHRQRPSAGVASRLYMGEWKPATDDYRPKRVRKSRAKGNGQPAPAQDAYMADARQAGAAGITSAGQSERHQCRQTTAARVINVMVTRGLLVGRHMGGSGKSRATRTYFLPEFAPDVNAVAVVRKSAPKDRPATVRLGDGEPIIPPHVKVQDCPSGKDHRFTFTPTAGWVGQITRDWRERRLGAQT
jgi:hypothetical protein